MNELTELANKYGTDKGNLKHAYTYIYSDYFEHMMNDDLKILEIGVDDGASIKMWLDYFPCSVIYGLDVLSNPLPSIGRYLHFKIDQLEWAKTMKNELFRYDIIIDDGSHELDTTIQTYENLKNSFTKYYFIEDLDAKRSKRAMKIFQDKGFKKLSAKLAVFEK